MAFVGLYVIALLIDTDAIRAFQQPVSDEADRAVVLQRAHPFLAHDGGGLQVERARLRTQLDGHYMRGLVCICAAIPFL